MNTKAFFIFLTTFLSCFLCAEEGIKYSVQHISNWYLSHQRVHIVEIDPKLYDIKPVKASDNGIGRESVLSIAKRYKAVAAINGGFFSIGFFARWKSLWSIKNS